MDIRDEGDRNPGAGNAYRTIGPKVGLIVGVVDIGKGAVAVLMAKALTGSAGAGMAAGAMAVVGHNWPIFLQLRGGRGAATTVGVFLALVPIPAIPLSLACLVLLPIIRSATLVLGLMMIPMPLLVWLTGSSSYLVVYSVALPVMVGIRHYLTSRNARRLKEEQAPGLALPQG
jgi:glycerol-3-phosphate acyltransferase PlsY